MNHTTINFIEPPETTVHIDGATFTLRPITMRILPALVTCVEPAFEEITRLMLDPTLPAAAGVLARQTSPICEAIALCTGVDAKTIYAMTPDRAAALLLVCCEVNADFFFRAVPSLSDQLDGIAPLLKGKIRAAMQKATPAIGAGPSSSSPAPATATETS
ncbi:hypothetical protein [Piscinibacter koreensis]|uniref:Uncharacterized protein n=1 Tax=Piscinibacter koreensis TaxID=2742824 RepID=A0A7Y6TZA7_9BURK|nr:hypothetical protein [Schlegelella koreensis]NUZ08942.1 hypothetical protein [Schlegelella koreensis]